MLLAAVRIIFSILVLAFASASATANMRVALVIGNSAYSNAPALTNPKNDAQDMAAALKALGFTVILGSDLDKSGMDRNILEFEKALSGAEAGVFHYSGHGLQVAGVNYLVPVDANLESAAALRIQAVRLDFIQETMEREAKTNILFLDACRNNPLTRNLARALGTRSAEIGSGLASMESGAGTLISFSTQPGNVALDGTGRNSPYSGPLIKAIGTPGEDVLSVLTAVRNAVMAATSDKQVPWDNNALRAKFYFNPLAPQSESGQLQVRFSEAAQAWTEHKDTKDIAVLEAFRKQFGATNPYYDTLADLRIKDLSSVKTAPTLLTTEALNVEAPHEPLPAEVAVDANVLRVIETDPFFANAPPVTVRSYKVGSTTSMTFTPRNGAASPLLTYTREEDGTVRWLRQGIISENTSSDFITISAKTDQSKTSNISVSAANGLIVISWRSAQTTKFGSSTSLQKLLHIEASSGNIFPVALGGRFSYTTITKNTTIPPASLGKMTISEETAVSSCEFIKKYDANIFHKALTGSAFLLSCEERKTSIYASSNNNGTTRTVFFDRLGIFMRADPSSPREQIIENGQVTTFPESATSTIGTYTIKSFEFTR